jgi:hypothetical protein
MAFTDNQIRQLSGKLLERNVRIREEAGRKLSYIEGWHAIDEANRVFGFDAWDRETVWADCVFEDRREAKASYAARVRIRVRAGDTLICRDGSGVGHGSGVTLGEAHESALKEAETDATKRALTTFGNLFGLALYDKQQNGVRRTPKRGVAVPLSWALLSGTGVLVSRHETPESFCTALRQAIEQAGDLDSLNALWAANGQSLGQLRVVCPDLRTAQGKHYADLLYKLHEQRVEKITNGTGENRKEAERASVDKSVLPLSTPKRQRDPLHRQYLAPLPCLVCGRIPSQAHHLRFAQLRSMGSKVSDEWTVPLCSIHHRALHAVGNEESWWADVGIDAKGVAEGLWRQSHRQNGAAASNGASGGPDDIPFLPRADDPPAAKAS